MVSGKNKTVYQTEYIKLVKWIVFYCFVFFYYQPISDEVWLQCEELFWCYTR